MHEHVLAAGLGGDEAEALVPVEPRHGAVGPVAPTGTPGHSTGPAGGSTGTAACTRTAGYTGTGTRTRTRTERQHVLGLRAPLPLGDQEGHPLPGGDHAADHDGRAVHEHLGATVVGGDEAVALARLVPGNRAENAHGGVGGHVAGDPDAARLRTPVALTGLELDRLSFAEHLRPAVADDLGGVHEQVRAAVLQCEEAEAPLGVEPANCPLGHDNSTSR